MTRDESGRDWLDASPDPTLLIDASGCLQWGNKAAADFFGWPVDDHIGRQILDLIHPDDVSFALMSLETVRGKEVGSYIELRVRTASGWRLVEAVGANHFDDPALGCLVVTVRDLTMRRRWELGRDDDALFRAVVHNSGTLLMLVLTDGTIVAVSGAVTRILLLDPELLEGRPLRTIVAERDRQAVDNALVSCRFVEHGTPDPLTVEAHLLAGDGREVPFELTLVDLADDPTVSAIVVSGHNITKLRLYQKALADMALRDPLTALPNRTAVDNHLERLLSEGRPVVVAFVDLDGFKALNDERGHLAGDQVLRTIGRRLASAVRAEDVVARFGGDEFVVIIEDTGEEAFELAQRLSDSLSGPMRIGDGLVGLSASVGVVHSVPGDTPAELLERADGAMYRVKRGRSHLDLASGPGESGL